MTTSTDVLEIRDRADAAPAMRGESCFCAVPLCGHATSDGKPFCIAHLASMPYVQQLQAELAERAAADRRGKVRRSRALARRTRRHAPLVVEPGLKAAS